MSHVWWLQVMNTLAAVLTAGAGGDHQQKLNPNVLHLVSILWAENNQILRGIVKYLLPLEFPLEDGSHLSMTRTGCESLQ